MPECVHYPALYDVGESGCSSGKCVVPSTPPAPVPTWGEITVEFPHGCVLETVICWDEPTFDRPPTLISDLAGVSNLVLPASYSVGIFPVHLASWGYPEPWQGRGVEKYELLIDGVVWATTLGVAHNGAAGCGPLTYTPPANCVTLNADHHPDWSTVRELSVRAYYNDVPRWIVWCYSPNASDWFCNEDTSHAICEETFQEPQRYRRDNLCDGYAANAPGAFGNFGTGIPCSTCGCTSSPDPCGVPRPKNWDRWDFERIDYTFTSPETELQCPIPFCEDFEDCGSAPEERFGTADCAATGFYCSPTHVLEAGLGDSNYWRHEAISALSPVYLAAVLWLPTTWTLPPSYSNDVLVLAVEGDPDDANPFFEGIALRITSDGAGNPTIYALGAYGRLGSSWTSFGSPLELCLGEPNCLQFNYWAGDNTLPPSSAFPVGEGIINGDSFGKDVRVRSDVLTPHAEAVIFGAIAYLADPSALVDTVFLDDVCYGQAGWINCACMCGVRGDVYLTRAIAPETADGGWSPPSAVGVVNLRGVSADSGGDGSGSPGSGSAGVQLGGARIKTG